MGTGKGFSVLDLINTFEEVTKVKIPKLFVDRREGDVSICYANPEKANNQLNWKTEHELKDMCLSAWLFSKNL